MRIFTCSVCQQTVFFENVQCTNCGHALGYLPTLRVLSALEPCEGESSVFTALAPKAQRARVRLCKNGIDHANCNWMIPADSEQELCPSCSLNSVIPNLEKPEALAQWTKLERCKRRLLYTLYELELPVESRSERPESGLAFAFMSDGDDGKEKVYTGHADGLITINTNEADDPFREQVRKEMGEAYRTLLGHFRHEIGHYYWDRLIRDTRWLPAFRALFGDERADYAEAMKRHYEQGTPPDWRTSYVSAYATMHPWEDWAETWAHYLHMVDTLGTARAFGLVLRPKPAGGSAEPTVAARALDFDDFDDLVTGWVPMTIALNSLNRSMGLVDPYPFVLSDAAIKKLRFVHEVIEHWNASEQVLARVLANWPAAVDPPPQETTATEAPAPIASEETAAPPAGAPAGTTVTVSHALEPSGATRPSTQPSSAT